MSWFRPRTWPKAGPLPVLVAKRTADFPLVMCNPLVFSVPLIAWWHFISRSKLAEFQACGEGIDGRSHLPSATGACFSTEGGVWGQCLPYCVVVRNQSLHILVFLLGIERTAVFHLLGKLVTQITCCDGPERARVLLSTEPPLSALQQSSDPDASTSWEH